MSEPYPVEPSTSMVTPPAPETVPGPLVEIAASSPETGEASAGMATSPVAEAPPSCLGLTRSDQWFVASCVALLLVLTGYHWATLGGWGSVPIELDRLPERQYDFRIDINSASWVEWTQIEGIGKATADKIIADRNSHGPFRKIDDLLRVKGIGPKTLEQMRPFLRAPDEPSSSEKAMP